MELKLRMLRKDKGYTQEQLAKAINATKRQVGAWERGENDIPMDSAVLIADLLGCSIDDIAGRRVNGRVFPLSIEEQELVDIMRTVTPEGQRQLMVYARGIAATYSKNNQVAKVG